MTQPTIENITNRAGEEWQRLCAFARQISESSLGRRLRLDRPAQFFLMIWPVLWGVCSASGLAIANLPTLILLTVVLRLADLLYEEFMVSEGDEKSEETTSSLPVLPAIAVLAVFAVWLALATSPATFVITVAWLAMVGAMPYLNRITWWPQIMSGFIYGAWAVLLGQSAGGFTAGAIPILLGAWAWVTAIETLRADSRRAQDLKTGKLKSIALMLGERSFSFININMVGTMVLLSLAGFGGSNPFYYAGLMVGQLLLTLGLHNASLDDEAGVRRAYHLCAWSGAAISVGFLLGF